MKDKYWEPTEELDSLEAVMVKVITKDEALQGILAKKVEEAIKTINFKKMIVANLEETIEGVFNSDDIFDMIDKAIKEELKKVITRHFDNS